MVILMDLSLYKKKEKKVTYNSLVPEDIPIGRVEVPFTTDTEFYLRIQDF
jgi:hypothetical protein